jgi:RNA polymerase sigma factor (TIGR02999 family)
MDSTSPLRDSDSIQALFPRVYRELKLVARSQLRRASGHSLDTTGLVHEAYFKLADLDVAAVADRAHFLAISARAMRQVLVAAARTRNRSKRGSGQRPKTFDDALVGKRVELEDVLAVHDALGRLQSLDPRLVQIVECRFFAGLTEDETAEALGISVSTVQRDWRRAKAWLRRYLDEADRGSA